MKTYVIYNLPLMVCNVVAASSNVRFKDVAADGAADLDGDVGRDVAGDPTGDDSRDPILDDSGDVSGDDARESIGDSVGNPAGDPAGGSIGNPIRDSSEESSEDSVNLPGLGVVRVLDIKITLDERESWKKMSYLLWWLTNNNKLYSNIEILIVQFYDKKTS